MPAKRKSQSPIVPIGMSTKHMKRKKPINLEYIKTIDPLTSNQEEFFRSYKNDQNLVAYGCAGTGKTFISLYLALQDVLGDKQPQDKVVVVRSLIPTREIGFLPGDEEDKAALYQVTYSTMMQFMVEQPNEQAFTML